jgi:hypothetical protein
MGTLSFANLGILFYLAATGLLLLSRTDVLAVTASPTVIEDERVRSLSVTPALGRGYSLLTNTFHSICLDVETPTEGTYNYDCKCRLVLVLWCDVEHTYSTRTVGIYIRMNIEHFVDTAVCCLTALSHHDQY